MRASSLRQHWSQGQCNIVDHRKLVLVINNDKNKQRWVHSRHIWEQDSNKIDVGLSDRGAGLSGVLKAHERHERCPLGCRPHVQYAEILSRKKLRSRTFVPLFLRSSAHP